MAHPDAVAPPIAHAGTILLVARCVPSIDASGEADRRDGLPVRDRKLLAVCDSDTVGERDTEGRTERVCDAVERGEAERELRTVGRVRVGDKDTVGDREVVEAPEDDRETREEPEDVAKKDGV